MLRAFRAGICLCYTTVRIEYPPSITYHFIQLVTPVFLFQFSRPEIFHPLTFEQRGISWYRIVVPFSKRRRLCSWVLYWAAIISGNLPYDHVSPGFNTVLVLSTRDEVLDRLSYSPSVSRLPAAQINDMSGEETNRGQPRRRMCPKRTTNMNCSYAVDDLLRYFPTGPTYASRKLTESHCWICRKNLSVLVQGNSEILFKRQGNRQFAQNQRLWPEIPSWRVHDFYANSLTEVRLGRQEDDFHWSLSRRDQEYPFHEDLIAISYGKVDPLLLMLAMVSSVKDVPPKLSASSELVE